MSSTYSPKLRFELVGAGEQAGLWGTTTNKNVGQLIEQAIAGVTTIDLSGLSGNYTLTALDGAPDQSRSAVLQCNGPASAAINLIIPTQTKLYVVRNDSGQSLTVKTTAQTGGVQLDDGEATLVFCNGTDAVLGLETAAAGTLGVDGGGTGQSSFTAGVLASTGGTNALGTYNASSPIPVAYGGTGSATLTANSVLLGNGTSALQAVAPGTSGNVLTSNGTTWQSTAPSSGTVTSVSGTGSVSGLSLSGTVTASGSLTLGGTLTLTSANVTDALGFTPANSSTTVNTSGNQSIGGTKTFTTGVVCGSGYNFTASADSLYWTGSEAQIRVSSSMRFFCGSSSAGFSISDVQKVGGGTFNSYSDRRYKQDITTYGKGLTDVKQLNPVNYRYTAEFMKSTEPSQNFVGLIAQDVQQTSFADSVSLDSQGYCVLDTNQMMYALINAVKELSAEVDALKAKLG